MITKIILLILFGAVMSLFQKFLSGHKKKDFQWSIFWRNNLPMAIFNLIFGLAAVLAIYMNNEAFVFRIHNFDYSGGIWLAIGFGGHYFWQLIFSTIQFIFEKFIGKLKKK